MASPGRHAGRSPRAPNQDAHTKPEATAAPAASGVNQSGTYSRPTTSPRQRPASPRSITPPLSGVASPRGSRNANLEAHRAIENCRGVFEHELLRLMEEKNRLERAIFASQDRMNRELDQLKKSLDYHATRTSSEPKLRELDVVRQDRPSSAKRLEMPADFDPNQRRGSVPERVGVRDKVVQLPEERKAEIAARDQSPSIFTKAVNKGEQLLRGLSAVPVTSPPPNKKGSVTEVRPPLTKERSGSMTKEHPVSAMKVEKQPSFGKSDNGEKVQPNLEDSRMPTMSELIVPVDPEKEERREARRARREKKERKSRDKKQSHKSNRSVRTSTEVKPDASAVIEREGSALLLGRIKFTVPKSKIVVKDTTHWIRCLQFNSEIIVYGCLNKSDILVWDLAKNAFRRSLKGHAGVIYCLQLSGNLLVSGGGDGNVKMWDLEKSSCTRTIEAHDGGVLCLQHSSKLLVSGATDHTVKVWDYQSGQLRKVLKGHTGSIWCVAFNDEGRIVSGSEDRSINIWDLNTGQLLKAILTKAPFLCLNLRGPTIITGSEDGSVQLWDSTSGEMLKAMKEHTGPVECMALNENLLVTGSFDKTIKIWDLTARTCLHTLKGHSLGVYCVAFDDSKIVSGSEDGHVRMWPFKEKK